MELKKNVNWSLIARKAWETRRKRGNDVKKSGDQKRQVKSEAEKQEDREWREDYGLRKRVFGEFRDVDGEVAKLQREMSKRMKRKTLIERTLNRAERGGIFVGKKMEKQKIVRWSGGVKIGS